MWKKSAFYLLVVIFVFAGQFLQTSGLVTGKPPVIAVNTLADNPAMANLDRGPALIYFWADWCGICRAIQGNVDAVLRDYPGLTVAVRSGDNRQVGELMTQKQLSWPTVSDPVGSIGDRYGIRAVPALFFLDRQGEIVFTSVGYTSEWGLRLRLWLAGLL